MSPAEAELAFALNGLHFGDYTRIAILENPFKRMVRLYDRIALTDPLWHARRALGGADPDFGDWLMQTRPYGRGAGHRYSPRWRQLGAWSAQQWSGGHITQFVRADGDFQDLQRIMQRIGINPSLATLSGGSAPINYSEMSRYDAKSTAIIHDRYAFDLQCLQRQPAELRLVA